MTGTGGDEVTRVSESNPEGHDPSRAGLGRVSSGRLFAAAARWPARGPQGVMNCTRHKHGGAPRPPQHSSPNGPHPILATA